jgi:hypothetical protein
MYLDRAGSVKLGCFEEATIMACKGGHSTRTDKSDIAQGEPSRCLGKGKWLVTVTVIAFHDNS